MSQLRWLAATLAVALLCAACGTPSVVVGRPSATTATPTAVSTASPGHSPTASLTTPSGVEPTPLGVSVAIVGDMVCYFRCSKSPDVAALTASLRPDAMIALGDLLNNTANWSLYEEQWGALKSITFPTPGNHEYSAGIDAYEQYWGAAAHPPELYYSFDLGMWHVVALNGEVDDSAGSPEEAWFKADLAAHPAVCTLVVIHEPRWSSSTDHPSDPSKQALWEDAVNAHVELWLAGHDHQYERFGALDANGAPSDEGTTELVIGTGGRPLYGFAPEPLAGELVRNNDTFGVGLFTLGTGDWSMQFRPIPGQTFADAASGTCH